MIQGRVTAQKRSRRYATHVPSWGAVLIVGTALGVWCVRSPRSVPFSTRVGMSEMAEYPVIRVAVNQNLRHVAQQSTYHFDFSSVVDVSSTIIDDPVIFDYASDGGLAFRLPPAGFVALSQSGGWVYDISVALPIGAKPLAEAYHTAVTVDSVLSGTHWRRTGGPLPTLEMIRRDFASAEWDGGGDHSLGHWADGTVAIVLTLKRSAERGDRTPVPGRRVTEDLYLVEVNVYDGARVDAYNKRTFNIRRARQHGNTDQPLPLEAVLDDPTPVPNVSPARTPRP